MKTYLTSIVCLISFITLRAQGIPEVGWVRILTTPDHQIQVHADWLDMYSSPDLTAALGYFYADLQIEGGPLIENPVEDDYLFLAVFDNWTGDYRWHATVSAQQGPLPFQFGQNGKVCGDADGNVYIAGHFLSNTLVFDNNLTLERSCSLGCEELFLAKYNSAGVFQWAKTFKAQDAESHYIGGLACDADGNVLLAGTYGGNAIDFGTSGFNYTNLPGNGFFLARFNPSGEPMWVSFLDETSNSAEAVALETTGTGNVFVTGRYRNGEIRFDDTHALPQYEAENDWFLSCYNLSGDVLWVKNLHSTDYLDILDLSTDGADRAYLVCDFSQDLRSGQNQFLFTNQTYGSAVVALSENVFYFPQFWEYDNDESYPITTVCGETGYESHWTGGFYFGGALVVNGVPLAGEGCADGLLVNATLNGDVAGFRTFGGAGCEGIANFYYGSGWAQDPLKFSYVTGVYENGFNLDGYEADNSGLFVTRFNTSIISTGEVVGNGIPLRLAPNPTVDHFTVNAPGLVDDAWLQVADFSGRIVFEQRVAGDSFSISHCLPAGVYSVLLTTTDGVSSARLQVVGR